MIDVEFAQLTDPGCVREINEDSIGHWPHEDGWLFAVADGCGGHNAGEVASAMALEVLAREMERAPGTWSVSKRLRRSIQEANLRIYDKAVTVPELHRMSTTLTATALTGAALVAAHVGDTRLYLLRAGKLRQLTKDHTTGFDPLQLGLKSLDRAREKPRKYILSRSIGHELIVSIDVLTLDVEEGDVLLQCSDGIHGNVPDAAIAALLASEAPEQVCRELVTTARDAGGDDNLSVQVARVRSCPPRSPRKWWQPRA